MSPSFYSVTLDFGNIYRMKTITPAEMRIHNKHRRVFRVREGAEGVIPPPEPLRGVVNTSPELPSFDLNIKIAIKVEGYYDGCECSI